MPRQIPSPEFDVFVRPTLGSELYLQCKLVFSHIAERCAVFLKFELLTSNNTIYLQYNAENLVPGKYHIRNTKPSSLTEIASTSIGRIERNQGCGELKILSLTLGELCPVLHHISLANVETLPPALVQFSRQKQLQIVLDWKQLNKRAHSSFKAFLNRPQSLSSFCCILPQLDNEAHWAISPNINQIGITTHRLDDLSPAFLLKFAGRFLMLNAIHSLSSANNMSPPAIQQSIGSSAVSENARGAMSEDPPVYTAKRALEEPNTPSSNKRARHSSANPDAHVWELGPSEIIITHYRQMQEAVGLERLDDTDGGMSEFSDSSFNQKMDANVSTKDHNGSNTNDSIDGNYEKAKLTKNAEPVQEQEEELVEAVFRLNKEQDCIGDKEQITHQCKCQNGRTEEGLETYNTPENLSTPRQLIAPSMLRLGVPDLLDVDVTQYSMWQQSRVGSETLKANTQKLCEVALKNGFDLQQISEEINVEFFVEEGVLLGVAMRFKRDIKKWVQEQKKERQLVV